MLISQKLEAMTADSKDARATVGAFMLEQRTNLQNLSMQQVADAAYTSRPTLVRIAKKLGYGGWNELVKKFVEECRYYENHFGHIDPNSPFEKGDSPPVIADKVGHVMIERRRYIHPSYRHTGSISPWTQSTGGRSGG